MALASHISTMIVALVTVLSGPAPQPAGAVIEAPPGSHPQLAFYYLQFQQPEHADEIDGIEPSSGERVHLFAGELDAARTLLPLNSTNITWSADGSHAAIMAIYGIHYQAVHVVDVDGGSQRLVPRTYPRDGLIGNPVISPDGRSVVFERLIAIKKGHPFQGQKAALFSADVESGRRRQITPWSQKEKFYPSAISADGSTLAATLEDRSGDVKAVTVTLARGHTTVWADDAQEPAFAPDGTLAAVRNHYGSSPVRPTGLITSDLLILAAPGLEKTILHQSGGIAEPTWDPSGARIAYTRTLGHVAVERGTLEGNSIEQVNADGSCRSLVVKTNSHGSVLAPSWRPGPAREAGSIRC